MFSIVIPSWNNLSLLKLCVRSIQQHSRYMHQIIVHINEGNDGTLEWVKANGFAHTYSEHNIGICQATNWAASLAQHEFIVYLNDDMYCCPAWDQALIDTIQQLDTSLFMLSGTMIEARDTGNPCVIVRDYGDNEANFAEEKLLSEVGALHKSNWLGATWPPTVVR
ncbi:MAG: glycosyltransferase [Ottowia sp.]|nr:glycosyltransferase [Ottowia sp.]